MKTKNITLAAVFAALMFVSSIIVIPAGAVPITLQTCVLAVSSAALLPKEAFLCTLLHMLIKLAFTSGNAVITPSFGFVLGFIPAGFLASLYFSKSGKKSRDIIITILIASLLPYLPGLGYMAYVLNMLQGKAMSVYQIFKAGMFIFIPGDILKGIISFAVIKRLVKIKK